MDVSLFVPFSFYLKGRTGINTLKKNNNNKQTMGQLKEGRKKNISCDHNNYYNTKRTNNINKRKFKLELDHTPNL